jgi:hypothetical protein
MGALSEAGGDWVAARRRAGRNRLPGLLVVLAPWQHGRPAPSPRSHAACKHTLATRPPGTLSPFTRSLQTHPRNKAARHPLPVHTQPANIPSTHALPPAPNLRQGASVSASDISAAMAGEAAQRYEAALAAGAGVAPATAPTFEASDLESVAGRYNTVTCLDVMIHYPQVRRGCGQHSAEGRKGGGADPGSGKPRRAPSLHARAPLFPDSQPLQSCCPSLAHAHAHAHAHAACRTRPTRWCATWPTWLRTGSSFPLRRGLRSTWCSSASASSSRGHPRWAGGWSAGGAVACARKWDGMWGPSPCSKPLSGLSPCASSRARAWHGPRRSPPSFSQQSARPPLPGLTAPHASARRTRCAGHARVPA